jgi:hypothetical protein
MAFGQPPLVVALRSSLGGIINVPETPRLLGFVWLLGIWLVARDLF